MPTITDNETPFACDMTALDGRQKTRVLELLAKLTEARREILETPHGYAFRFEMDDAVFLEAAEFVTLERRCCPFFEFALAVEKESASFRLILTGPEGVKDFIRIEFGF
jgi:hypothetical protein